MRLTVCGLVSLLHPSPMDCPDPLMQLRPKINNATQSSFNISTYMCATNQQYRHIQIFNCVITVCMFVFLPRDALVHSAVLRLHVVRPSVRPSVCDVGGSGSHRLEILETNCTVN